MKVKLLKKLRKRAYKRIGMLYFKDNRGWDTYAIGLRMFLTPDYDNFYIEHSLTQAKYRLAWYRREMILQWVNEEWENRCQDRLKEKNKEKNKDIIKL